MLKTYGPRLRLRVKCPINSYFVHISYVGNRLKLYTIPSIFFLSFISDQWHKIKLEGVRPVYYIFCYIFI